MNRRVRRLTITVAATGLAVLLGEAYCRVAPKNLSRSDVGGANDRWAIDFGLRHGHGRPR